jgi:imidazolonepropionase-like amidohydrolase
MYVLRNCGLIPELTEGTDLTQADLLLDEGKIAAIKPCGTVFSSDCEELDVEGAVVMPGLIDMHTHLRMYSGSGLSDPLKPCSVTLDELLFAQFYLDNGYTTVRDVGDNIANPAIALRNHINAGRITGPRIFCSGPTLTPTEFGFDAAWSEPNHYEVDSPESMRKMVRFCIQKGSDFIKLYGSGSMIVKNGQPGALIMEPDEMAEAVKLTARKNTYCAIHMHGAEGCDIAAKTGVRTIEHASYIRPDTLKYLETRKQEGHGIVITISCLLDDAWGVVPEYVFGEVTDHLRRAKDYDVLIGWGTDTSLKFYQENPFAEFEIRSKDLGFSNIEILKQATINSAVLMMKDHLIGSVKEGKLADLIVVDGNPVEDLTVMAKKPLHVLKDGVLIR